jgi:uncharacterized protein (UPF0332 family)
MAFQWEDYLILAEDLGGDENDEAALRCAVSRAYYAAFHVAKDFLNGLDDPALKVSENKQSIHYEVWKAFLGRGRHWESVYNNGDRLRKRRVDADYEPEPKYPNGKLKNWSKEVEQSLHEADNVLQWVRDTAGKK